MIETMDIDQTITEIERLERMFAVPDTRPLTASDLSMDYAPTSHRGFDSQRNLTDLTFA